MQSSCNQLFLPRIELDQIPKWEQEKGIILDLVNGYHAQCNDYANLKPIRNGFALRDDLKNMAPSLASFAELILSYIGHGACAVYIPELGLKQYDKNTRALLVYALGVCLGTPTYTDHTNQRVIWDIKPRAVESGYFATFSETDQEAAFHTDTQYFPHPEKYFLLYVIEPASCGGGRSQICDARLLFEKLEKSDKRWICEYLRIKAVPFRIPSAFSKADNANIVQATIAPIFSDTPFIRYRKDTLMDGIKHFPSFIDAETIIAIELFELFLQRSSLKTDFFMAKDSLLFMDNHIGLHARSAFIDRSRHLLRIRIHSEFNSMESKRVHVVEKKENEVFRRSHSEHFYTEL